MPAHAHLILAQKGTVNFVEEAAFMVVSVPVSAFRGIDDDDDGQLSRVELDNHQLEIRTQFISKVKLLSDEKSVPLQLLLVDISPSDNSKVAIANQIIVLGRFDIHSKLIDSDQMKNQSEKLKFEYSLFGIGSDERQQDFTMTRNKESQWIRFTPEQIIQEVMPSFWETVLQHVKQGLAHVLQSIDHLLFLLVVLSVRFSIRAIAIVLSCFTVGHAISMVAVVFFSFPVNPSVVEPAIAATIVGIGLLDRLIQNRKVPMSLMTRSAIVFSCALIHGLGFASGLSELNLDLTGKIISLVGFNAGIELGQLFVAFAFVSLLSHFQKSGAPRKINFLVNYWPHFSIGLGSLLFVHRIFSI